MHFTSTNGLWVIYGQLWTICAATVGKTPVVNYDIIRRT